MQVRTVVLNGICAIGLVTACGRTQIDFDSVPGATGGSGNGSGGTLLGGTGGGGVGNTGNVGGGVGGGSTGGVGNVGGGGVGGEGACGGLTTECGICTCETCPDEWDACEADGGCFEILSCAQQAGCSGIQCYLGPCMQVIDQNGGVFGDSAGLAQAVASCADQGSCPCGDGGSGGGSGMGGMGGVGGGPSGGGGSGGTGPLACLSCINNQCPEVQECLFDQVCRDGVICAFQTCLGGGGTPSLGCMLGCFDGDFQAAFQAFQALQCFTSQCGQTCGGLIPGLPGGGGPGNPGN